MIDRRIVLGLRRYVTSHWRGSQSKSSADILNIPNVPCTDKFLHLVPYFIGVIYIPSIQALDNINGVMISLVVRNRKMETNTGQLAGMLDLDYCSITDLL